METVLLFVLISTVKPMVVQAMILCALLAKMDLCLLMEPANPAMSINVSSVVLLDSVLCVLIIFRPRMELASSVMLHSAQNVKRKESARLVLITIN